MRTLFDLYERNANLYPDAAAFVCEERTLTYGAHLSRARQLGSALRRAGLSRQDRVGLFAANSIEYFEICAGCEAGSLISALFNFRSAAPELEYLIHNSGTSLLFFDSEFRDLVDVVRATATTVRHYVCIGGDVPSWAVAYEDFLAAGDPAGVPDRPAPEDFCTLFYTSGTTGRPKGVPYRHDATVEVARRNNQGEEMALLQSTPAYHVGGRLPPLGAVWTAGKTVLTTGGFDPRIWLATVERERITNTFMVPMMMQAVLDHPDFDKFDISSLTGVMAASTAIPPPLLVRAVEQMGPVFYIAYGSTEGAGITRMRRTETRGDGPPEMTARLASVGHAEPPVELALLDDDGKPVPHGEVGEVCIKSYTFIGYWNDPEATAASMHGDYVRTGDMGRFDDRFYLYLVDRKKDMIISGGENIYSREVEDALYAHPAVEGVAVIGVADKVWGETVNAVVVVKPGQTLDEETLVAFSRTKIARYKCPKTVHFVDALPLSGPGKIDKVLLRKRFATTLQPD